MTIIIRKPQRLINGKKQNVTAQEPGKTRTRAVSARGTDIGEAPTPIIAKPPPHSRYVPMKRGEAIHD
jgi:hypothetical protein